jgi:trehalose synthase
MQDTEFLRLTLNLSLKHGVAPMRLVHAMQNHDEMTYELVHFATLHKDEHFNYHGEKVCGSDLAELVRAELTERLTGPAAPYNLVFTTNGIASTTATIIAASLGIDDLDAIDAEATERIKKAHLLLAMFNAWQPGVFALSGWDLCGMLTLDRDSVAALLATGDTRWIHRSSYDLMGYGNERFNGMPRGRSLYGTLPEQLEDPESFASQLRTVLDVRETSRLAVATQLDVPPVSHRGMLVMVHQLPGTGPEPADRQVTVLNFGQEAITGTVRSEHLVPRSVVTDMSDKSVIGEVDDLHSFSVALEAHEGVSLLISAPPVETAV